MPPSRKPLLNNVLNTSPLLSYFRQRVQPFTGGILPPFTANNIDAVVRREILPDLLDRFRICDEFGAWEWHGFNASAADRFTGLLSAFRIRDQRVFTREVTLFKDTVMNSNSLDHLFRIIDAEFEFAVHAITAMANPHDVNTCVDPECPC